MRRPSTPLAAAAVMVLVACGQPPVDTTGAPAETSAAPTETTAAVTGTTAAAAAGAFCTPAIQLKTALTAGPDVDFETATEEEIGAAMEEFGASVAPLVEEVTATAPPEIADDVTTVTDTLNEVLQSGDDSLTESEEFTAADGAINQYLLDNCGLEAVSVSAVEYSFSGIPDTLPAGLTAFEFSNEGQELHEMVVFRINEGVTQSVEELLQLPEEEAGELASDVAGTFAMPGESNVTFVDLEPGRYAFVCFVPVGTTPENVEALESGEEEGGPPHFTQGMFTEVTVDG
jgi:hypothetical protein